MMDLVLEAAHRAWLDPDSGRRRQRGGCLCSMCGEVYDREDTAELSGRFYCLDCIDGNTFPFDVYPEEEEAEPICSVCGFHCEKSMIRLFGVTYCTDCAEEGGF